ncbi:MAG TPA: alpha/beta fold hydrolase [Pirellulales bacterium]|jgi:hypothetical protein
MKVLFLHGWQSKQGGLKPSYLVEHGLTVINPALPDEDFAESVRIAECACRDERVQVIVGSSRGGAVAMNVDSAAAMHLAAPLPMVLLCPAWKRWGTARTVPAGTVILHSRADDIIPFADSQELVERSGLSAGSLIEVGRDHRLADPEPLAAMLAAIKRLATHAG